MADEIIPGADAGAGAGDGAGAGAADTTVEPKEGEGAAAEGAGAGEGAEGEEGKQGKEEVIDDDGSAPVTQKRRTKESYIIERKQKQLDRAKAKAAAGEEGAGDGADGGEAEGEDEEAEDPVKRVIEGLSPILEQQLEAEDRQEADAFLVKNPDFAPFKDKALRYMKDPSRRHLPVSTIFFELAGNQMLKMGAERGRAADDKAKQSQAGGGTATTTTKKSVAEMSPEEFESYQQEVIQRGS